MDPEVVKMRRRVMAGGKAKKRWQKDSMGERDSAGSVSSVRWLHSWLDKTGRAPFLTVFAWRLVNALTIHTFFQADEYWQALEPAHRAVFGYGYLTWEWRHGLRSYLHPLLYMLPYWVVKQLDGDYWYVLVAPKVVNAVIAAVGDYYLYDLVESQSGSSRLAKLASLLSLFSAWNWYCWCRSFANSLELTLTIIALCQLQSAAYVRCLMVAAFTCLIRPTNAVIWIYSLPGLFWQQPRYIAVSGVIALVVVSLDAGVNYWFYSGLQLPLWSFFKFNVTDSLSSFYGVSRIDFYFLQAIPVLLLNYLPFFVYGLLCSPWSNLKGLLLCYLLVFTAIPHKEFRFIYPMMPVLLTYSASGVLSLSAKISPTRMKQVLGLTLSASVLLAYYFTQYHEVGELQIPTLIRNRITSSIPHLRPVSVGFLTPCHSTPFQSHFHLPENEAELWFLTCEPPLSHNMLPGMALESYMDESDYFYANPRLFLETNFPADIAPEAAPAQDAQWPHRWPDYIVMFGNLWDDTDVHVQDLLGKHYTVVERVWNTPGHWDDRRKGDILLLQLSTLSH